MNFSNQILLTILLAILSISCKDKPREKVITIENKGTKSLSTFTTVPAFKNRQAHEFYLSAEQFAMNVNYLKAKEYYEQALSLEPNNKIILNSLGNTEMHLINFNRATELFNKAIKIDSSYYIAYSNLGLNLLHNKEYNKSIEILKKVPQDSTIFAIRSVYFSLFMNYARLRECDSAYYYCDRALKSSKDIRFLNMVNDYKNNELVELCMLKPKQPEKIKEDKYQKLFK